MASNGLMCSICPSKPGFSDQSHLLTHIGSKGHLSHYFKAQVRGRQEVAVRERLRQYDVWYEHHNIEELLSQRLKAKETKTAPRRSTKDKKVPLTKKRAGRKKLYDDSGEADYDLQSGQVIDPSLQSQPLLPVPSALSKYPRDSPIKAEPGADRRAPIARMVYTNEQREGFGHASLPDEFEGAETPSFYANNASIAMTMDVGPMPYPSTPRMQSSHERNPHPDLQASATDSGTETPTASEATVQTVQSRQADPAARQYGRESAILKGIIFPGMDLFDTASEDARRKRNQKKDNATLLQMEVESETFEPTEVIYYYPSWEPKKARYISGEVESSPPPGLEQTADVIQTYKIAPALGLEQPPISTKAGRKRVPLSELDVNTRRTRKTKARKANDAFLSGTRLRRAGNEDIDSDYELETLDKPTRQNRHFEVYKDSPVKTEQVNIANVDQADMSNAFLNDTNANILTDNATPYFAPMQQPQPLSAENISFLGSTNFFDRPRVVSTPPQDYNVMRFDALYSSGLPTRFEDFGGPPTNQRYFTTGTNDFSQMRMSVPPYADMAMAFASQQSQSPFGLGLYTSNDPYSYQQGHQFYQMPSQEAPIDFRHYPHSRQDMKSPLSDSDETIADPGLNNGNVFFGA